MQRGSFVLKSKGGTVIPQMSVHCSYLLNVNTRAITAGEGVVFAGGQVQNHRLVQVTLTKEHSRFTKYIL